MNSGIKIRLLLLILTLCFIGTAITIKESVTNKEILDIDTKSLNDYISEQEKKVDLIFKDSLLLKTFKNYDQYPIAVYQAFERYKNDQEVYLFLFKDHQPKMWSTNLFVPITDQGFLEKSNFVQDDNRSYVIRKKTIGNISILAYILVKPYTNNNNPYLNSSLRRNFFDTRNIDIASYTDTVAIKNIYSNEGSYLFSVKLKDGEHENIYTILQFFCWLLAWIALLIFFNSLCLHMAKTKRAWWAIVLLAGIFVLVKFADLKWNLLSENATFAIFDSRNYAYNRFFPNIWSVLSTTILILWWILFIYSIRKELNFDKIKNIRLFRLPIAIGFILSIYFAFALLYDIAGTLITHSNNIYFDFTKLVDLHFLSWVDLGIVGMGILALSIYIDLVLFFLKKLELKPTQLLNIQLACVIFVILIISIYIEKNSLVNLLLALIILIKSFGEKYFDRHILTNYIAVLILWAIISTITHARFYQERDLIDMKILLNNLQSEDDVNAVSLFSDIENGITNDKELKHLFNISLPYTNTDAINDFIKKKYFSGYLSKYDFKAYYYDQNSIPLNPNSQNKINEYREKVINKSIKVTQNFYRASAELGTHEYFSIIPVTIDQNRVVNVIINLSNKDFSYTVPYPEILTDMRINNSQYYNKGEYSIALYKGGSLVTQFGKYTYENNLRGLKGVPGEYIEILDRDSYLHMAYVANTFSTYVISKQKPSFWDYVATSSFLFLVFFMIFMLFHYVTSFYIFLKNTKLTFRNLKYQFYKIINKIQYSTRIQTSIISSVILAILISAVISYISINKQLYNNNRNSKERFIIELGKRIENMLPNTDEVSNENQLISILKTLSETISKDFNLYSKSGRLLYSSQRRIYDLELFSTFINPIALKNLSLLKKSETIEDEGIGTFQFETSYVTIRDKDYSTVAYIGIPNFSLQKEENINKNLLLNTIVNIYSLIIIGFGFYATFVANSVTNPLSIISRKISQLRLGQPNEPLFWQRNDEIGTLIKEYNLMIIKLEDYANKIKDTERESTWREMAQQIAHEIKNPLTPMKLGIQQLRRSYKDNDPKFPDRFNKFSTSFIEQIDALTQIASEFSHFAKFPTTVMENINIVEKVVKSISLYNNTPNVNIRLINNADQKTLIVKADGNELLRTFNNLIKNAIEGGYGRKNMKIEISIERYSDKFVKIDVKDNGYGIPEGMKDQIFQINFTTKSSGNGLGLVLVKKTIEACNGQIYFETMEGEGTTFHILLPLQQIES
ncbi:sensor histidine kinase [Sphingobacterium puteale]|uniref:histidine kinase n=1 Tax=Sphingobacterium puteale TaxID=2420510 RepID=A0A420VYR3_9SPHI|nr:HAMP domain-containing sensor histidine kinase [Sphingobacterium puteale]RKO71530.1 sensor histidine kinase [Sphingobacterium puteale]